MKHSSLIIIPLAAMLFLVMAGCHHDSAVMQELSRIDSMVYHQQEKEALPLLQQINTEQLSKEERAYHSVLLAMAMYKNYLPFTSDSAIKSMRTWATWRKRSTVTIKPKPCHWLPIA